METVQLQCGSCGKVMAISTEHLGGQVRCPHCLSVVQTPPRPEPAPVVEMAPAIETREVESIFTPPPPPDDLFDEGPQRPFVEMPSEQRSSEAAPVPVDGGVTASLAPQEQALHAGYPTSPAENDGADLAALRRPRPVVDRSYLSLMAFMFLIPYCVLATAIIVYLMIRLNTLPHPLDTLPDPLPKKGGPKATFRTKHDTDLAEHQKVPLGKTVAIGKLEVKPVNVTLNELGELSLLLHVKNISRDETFSPMHPDFLKVVKTSSTMPYSFVDSRSFVRLYDQHLAFRRGGAEDLTGDGELHPGEDEDVLVTVVGNKSVVDKMIAAPDAEITWRVQLRRGLVAHNGQNVSVTAVIGVQFTGKDIGKKGV